MLVLVVILVVLATAIWVDRDARKLVAAGATKSQMGGNAPLTWSIATILVWIIVFPWYLVKRGQVRRELGIISNLNSTKSLALLAAPPGPLPDRGWYCDPTNALQERLWDGHTWTNQVRISPPKI
jgi:hypothetical protein